MPLRLPFLLCAVLVLVAATACQSGSGDDDSAAVDDAATPDAATPDAGTPDAATAIDAPTPDARIDAPSCVPSSCSASDCGTMSDGCGNSLDCEGCPVDQVCGTATNANACCTPATCAAGQCGTIPDGCGGTVVCGDCAGDGICGALAPNTCCVPTTCAAEGADCGTISDGCGSTLPCGTCTGPDTCGGGLENNVCAICPSGLWSFDVVDGADDVGAYNAITTDAARGVHVVYQDWTDHAFRYAYKPLGGTWIGETISTFDYMGWDSDIVVDAAGGVHVSFQGVSRTELYYSYRSPAGTWTRSTVDATTDGESNSIAVGADGTVHISYIAGQPGAGPLTYATRPASGGPWTRHTFGLTADKYDDTTIVVNPAGVVRILYGDSPSDSLRLAQRLTPASTWTVQTITSSGSPGYSSLAVDADDGLHISFHRHTTNAMHYGYRPANGTWTTWMIDDTGLVGTGLWTEIAVEPTTGRAHIVYYERHDDLRYATGIHGGSWTAHTLDSISSIGQYSSIAVDADHGVHVSYYDSLNQNLEYQFLCPY